VPILSIVIGEGGSGGALALAVADQVWMLENAIYAILSPEGYASILWKDAKRANEAASEMKLTANDLLSLGIIDRIIDEPETMNEESLEGVATNLKEQILSFLSNSNSLLGEDIANKRYERFRRM
jgi:acyl-CoA carboxylase subunit beta